MKKIQKIAIPTDDGLTIRQNFRGSRAFFVMTIRSGMIVRQELRWNLLSEILTSGHGFYYNLPDCDVVIVKEIRNNQKEYLQSIKKKIHLTDQPEIAKAIIDYLEGVSRPVEEKQMA